MIEPGAIKVVAFDCDGVMFDSSQANHAYYNHILEHVGLPAMTTEQFAFAHMHTVDETLTFLIRDPEALAQANAYRRRMSYLPFIRYMVIEPGLRPLLTKLKLSHQTAIATNRTDTMERVLAEHDLENIFDAVVTARDVRHPKPHPEQLLALLRIFDVEPRHMVYIGDSELDAAAAHDAGVPFIAYANNTLRADAHIQRLEQIADLLDL